MSSQPFPHEVPRARLRPSCSGLSEAARPAPSPHADVVGVVEGAGAVDVRMWRICCMSSRALVMLPFAACTEPRDAVSRSWLAFHCEGVKPSNVVATPAVPFVADWIWAFRSSMRGCTAARFDGFTCEAALAERAVRSGIAVASMPSAVAAKRAAGRTRASTRYEVKMVDASACAAATVVSPAILVPSTWRGAMSACRYDTNEALLEPR